MSSWSAVRGLSFAVVLTLGLLLGSRNAHAQQACTTSADCTADPNAPICDSLLGGGCPSGTCTNKCRKCTTGLECTTRNPSTTVCSLDDGGPRAGQCLGCISNSNCQGPTPVCDVGSATCVGCLGSGDCQNNANPICDQTRHQCVSCSNDFEPNNPGLFACSNPALPACQKTTESSQQGACTECSSTNPGICPSEANAPKCTVSKGLCGCQADADCGTKNGRVCDASANGGAGVCVPGCRVVGGVDNCPDGQTCSAQDGGLGVCQGQTCTGDSDCTTAPRTHCDLNQTHTCVECVSDSQCTGGKVCATETTDPSYGKCVECTPTKQNNCTSPVNPSGDKCLGSSDTCGCVNDGDCGDVKSGRVCDDTGNHKCRDGCRGTGGNGCPDIDTCTSKDHSIGDCNPKVGGDGGAGDGGNGTGDDGGNGLDGSNGNGGNGKFPLDGIIEGGGCACNVTGGGPGSGVALAIGLAFGLTAVARRRRNRNRKSL